MALERIVVDQMGYEVGVPHTPRRVISLVPSQTELIYDLGCADSLEGITKFCVHPRHLRKEKSIIGGTKDFRFDVIDQLKPDLIIGNKEENYEEGINRLKEKYPVWMSDIYTLDDSLRMIADLGSFLNVEKKSNELVTQIRQSFNSISINKTVRTLYFIWNAPKMVAGRNTFIDEMLHLAGFKNAINETRYPEISDNDLVEINPDVILLSSEPFPFKEHHIDRFKQILPNSIIKIVDGEMFSWYGSRLRLAPDYFIKLQSELNQPDYNLSNI